MCRAIGMFRTSYSFVAMSRPNVPDQLALMWYGNYNPAASQYTPLYLASEYLPEAYTRYVRETLLRQNGGAFYYMFLCVSGWLRSAFQGAIAAVFVFPVPGVKAKVARRTPCPHLYNLHQR
jgi:dipeptidase